LYVTVGGGTVHLTGSMQGGSLLLARCASSVAAVALLLALVAPAHAAFPGENGKIVFSHGECSGSTCIRDVYTVTPNGTDLTKLTSFEDARVPAFSPDGERIAFARATSVNVMDVDGLNVQQVLDWGAGVGRISWAPDGERLVAALETCEDADCRFDLYTMKVDGTALTDITPDLFDERDPTWSPDDSAIAYTTGRDGGNEIRKIAPDGTNPTKLTGAPSVSDNWPSWSPDGTRIAFDSSRDGRVGLWSMNADGSDQQRITAYEDVGNYSQQPAWSPDGSQVAFGGYRYPPYPPRWGIFRRSAAPGAGGEAQVTTSSLDLEPDWQPAGGPPTPPPDAYARPKAATPVSVPLTPAYLACTAPNRMHGPSLAFPSCAPPGQTSAMLTVGTPDANHAPANSVASLQLAVLAGVPGTPEDEADVRVGLNVSDVYVQGRPTRDYGGELELAVKLRITDKDNPAGTTSVGATVEDTEVSFAAQCTPTPGPPAGASCAAATTFDAIVPGVVKERQRAIWELGQVEVRDGGPDGLAATAPNSRFLVQGLFVP
jgi:Tol biopolymer transport system component